MGTDSWKSALWEVLAAPTRDRDSRSRPAPAASSGLTTDSFSTSSGTRRSPRRGVRYSTKRQKQSEATILLQQKTLWLPLVLASFGIGPLDSLGVLWRLQMHVFTILRLTNRSRTIPIQEAAIIRTEGTQFQTIDPSQLYAALQSTTVGWARRVKAVVRGRNRELRMVQWLYT